MATDSAQCKFCGTFWIFETNEGRLQGGYSGFIWSTIMSHINMCESWSPEERLAFIDRNEKRLQKKKNLHTDVVFDRNHPGVAKTPANTRLHNRPTGTRRHKNEPPKRGMVTISSSIPPVGE